MHGGRSLPCASKTAKNSSMDSEFLAPIGPRVVTQFRRVTVPRFLRERARWGPGSVVEMDVLDQSARIIQLRTWAPRSQSHQAVRSRPRTVTQVGQVSIPAAVLSTVGLMALSRVYFVGLRTQSDTVWLLPEDRLAFTGKRQSLIRLLDKAERTSGSDRS
jgi:bifunctional DNA-binding transcriptional regulator/antitoxin component of YhaV-PrlF toxin-antitoxin module